MNKDINISMLFLKLKVPPHANNLEQRIIETAWRQERAATQKRKIQRSWVTKFFSWRMAPVYALASLLVAIWGVVIPAWKAHEQQIAYQRYTVDGVPLLDDLALIQEPDLGLDRI